MNLEVPVQQWPVPRERRAARSCSDLLYLAKQNSWAHSLLVFNLENLD